MNFNSSYFHFENGVFLTLLLIAATFIFLEIFLGKKIGLSIKKLRKFIDEHLIEHLLVGDKSKKNQFIKTIITTAIFSLLIIALANPRWGFTEIDSYKPNINLVLLVDLSRSMNADDEKPSRLERVKQEIKDIIDNIEGVNIGIVGFANNSHVISPISSDKNAIEYLLPSITTDLISVQGSNIKVALKAASNLLKTSDGGINYVILMSDGDFENNIRKNQFDNSLENAGLISYSFGKNQGAPMKEEDGSYYKYGGKIIISKLGEENLRNLSGNENFIKSSYLDDDLNKLKNIIQKKKIAEKSKYQTIRIWDDKFYIPLIIAMIMLLPFFRKGSFFPVIIICFMVSFSWPVQAKSENEDFSEIGTKITSGDIFRNKDQQAVKQFEENNFDAAYEGFSSSYNKGVAAFRKQNFEEAEKQFSTSGDGIDTQYNLANSQLMQMKLEEAIKNYEEVLAKNENHDDAKHNLEIAKKLLKNQKQQNKQNQNKNENKKQNQQNKDDNNKNNQSGDQNEKDKNGKGNEQKDQNKQDKNDGDSESNQDNKQGNDGDKKENDNSENKNDGKNENDKSSENEQKNNNSSNNSAGENGNNNQESNKQKSGKNVSPELDKKAKEMFNKIKGDPENFMKNRFKHDEKSKNKLLTPDELPRPW